MYAPRLLRWVYLGRLALAGGIFGGAVVAWRSASWEATLLASLALIITLAVTVASYAFTHLRKRPAGVNFLYGEAVYDVLLVTAVVHLTGGADSALTPLYILVISAYALLLPFRGGLLVAGLSCIALIADEAWAYATELSVTLVLQLAIFASVALVVGVIGTRLREAGRELSTMESELEQLRLDTTDILRNIHTAVLSVDGFGTLTYANPAAEGLLDLDARLWTGRPILEQLERRSPALRSLVQQTARLGFPVASVEVAVRRGEETVPVGVSTAVLERANEPPTVTAIMRDISDVKRLEELNRRAERLEAVAELSASLAHEIKNPLAAIRSSVEQLAETVLRLRRTGADERLLADLILRETDRLSRLLSEFIDFARVQVGHREVLDLREVVESAVEVVRRHPAYRDSATIRARLDDRPVRVHGDGDLLHRVAFNLLLNAVQAAAEVDRPVHIDIEALAADDVPPVRPDLAEGVVLRVRDDGPGIPRESLGRIFDPFFSGRGGTGLGLAVVHRAVEAHGGAVFVDSSPPAGATFTLYFPGAREGALTRETVS
ncbi:MAG: two-component system sensor histidine kinase NtrB [Gemmatimonadota bacterium]